MEKRLQKIISEMGITSRRKAEDMILEGRVTVNGHRAVIGMKADPSKDSIKINGKLFSKPASKVYLMFNKPRAVVTSLSDPEGRATVKDFLKGVKQRVYPVGRLDYDTEGLLLLTNDGEFTHKALHPSKEIIKTYLVKVKGVLEEDNFRQLERGVRLKDGLTAPARLRKVRMTENNSWIEVSIHEGRKRQVRRMLESVGHPVLKLKRTSIDGIKLGLLKTGKFRHLTSEEINKIKAV